MEAESFEAPLPPTPISREAQTRLKRWGVPADYLEELRRIASLYRYDRCPQKAARIARRGGYLYRDENDIERVALPHFFDRETRLDGQCGDIATQLLRGLIVSGYLKRLNQALKEKYKPPVLPYHVEGNSRTHFNKKGARHIWVGLLSEGEAEDNMVVVDASFQEIENLELSGYEAKKPRRNPPYLIGDLSVGTPISELRYENDSYELIEFSSIVLGVSFDRRFAYGLGFSRMRTEGKVYPFIDLLRDLGDADAICLIGSDGGYKWLGNLNGIEDGHKKEVEAMLTSLEKMEFEPNKRKAEEVLGWQVTIKVKDQ